MSSPAFSLSGSSANSHVNQVVLAMVLGSLSEQVSNQFTFVTFRLLNAYPHSFMICTAETVSPLKLWWGVLTLGNAPLDPIALVATATFTDYTGRVFSIVTSDGADGVLTDTATNQAVSLSLIYGAIFRGRIYKHQWTSNWRDNNGQPYSDTSVAFNQAIWCNSTADGRVLTVNGVIAPITTRLVGNSEEFYMTSDPMPATIIGRFNMQLGLFNAVEIDVSLAFSVILPDGSTSVAYYRYWNAHDVYSSKWRLGTNTQLNQGTIIDYLGAHYRVVDGELVDRAGVPFGPFTEPYMPPYMYGCYTRNNQILYKYPFIAHKLEYYTNEGVLVPASQLPNDVIIAIKYGVIGAFSPALIPLTQIPSVPPVVPTTLVPVTSPMVPGTAPVVSTTPVLPTPI